MCIYTVYNSNNRVCTVFPLTIHCSRSFVDCLWTCDFQKGHNRIDLSANDDRYYNARGSGRGHGRINAKPNIFENGVTHPCRAPRQEGLDKLPRNVS